MIVPLLTFSQKGCLDIQATESYVDELINSPLRRVIALGSTGEGLSQSHLTKCQLVNYLDTRLPDDFDIFVCPSTWAVEDFVQIVKSAKRVVKILYLPSAYLDRDDRHAPFLHEVAKATGDLPIYLYHLPKNTGVNFTPETLRNRFQDVNLTGLKLSHSTYQEASQYKDMGFEVLYGSDSSIHMALDAGCDAVVCQNLSPSFGRLSDSFSLSEVQEVCDATRSFVKRSSLEKIHALKKLYISETDK